MEWLYGLLIGSSFTALLMHLAHRGHKEEREFDGYKVRPNGMIEPKIKEPWYIPQPTKEEVRKFPENVRADVATHLERRNTVGSLDDVPTNCSCDWAGDQTFCEAEPSNWYRTIRDPKCDAHGADDAWLERQ